VDPAELARIEHVNLVEGFGRIATADAASGRR